MKMKLCCLDSPYNGRPEEPVVEGSVRSGLAVREKLGHVEAGIVEVKLGKNEDGEDHHEHTGNDIAPVF